MIDFSKIRTYPIKERKNKVKVNGFYKLDDDIEILENKDIEKLAAEIVNAYKDKKQVILMLGGHVIKCGLSNYIIDLMKKGIITHLAFNGATSIHDFEIALIGETSEDVAENIENGSFGMVEETGKIINDALKKYDQGYGYAVGKEIDELGLEFKESSIQYWAYKLNIPLTVHVAIGTDIIHQHPSCDGSALGKASYYDFKLITDTVSKLEKGVIVNIGSAVILPEVFLKALTIARNLGFKVDKFVAANMDMIDHYRPKVNVVERPTSKGGIGLNIIEQHEKTVPNLYKKIIEIL